MQAGKFDSEDSAITCVLHAVNFASIDFDTATSAVLQGVRTYKIGRPKNVYFRFMLTPFPKRERGKDSSYCL
jgi:hypothetical protein